MDMQTGDYIGGPLAAVYQAQSESANIGAKNLENLVKGMSLPKEQLEMQKYQALLDDPNYVKANAQFQIAATQAKLGDEEKKVAINGLDRVLIQLQAYQGDPAKQREVIMQSFREKGVDPTSPMGQAILADPYGKTMEARDKLASTFARTPEHMGLMEKERFTQGEQTKRTEAEIAGRLQGSQISAGATRYAADVGAQYKDLAQLGSAIKESGQYVQSLQKDITKLTTEEGKNEAINSLIASAGMTKEQATSAVNSGAYKESLQRELDGVKAQYDHLKQQSPYYKGFDFSKKSPAPTSDGLPAGVTRKDK